MVRRLIHDPIVQLLGGLLLLVAIPYLLPGLSSDQLWYWTLSSEIPILVLSIVAFRYGLGRVADSTERRFWNLLSLALGAWLLKALLNLGVDPLHEPPIEFELAINVIFVLFYLFVAMALECQPNQVASRFADAMRAVERVGTLVFFTGLLLYLAVLPALLDPESYDSSSLLLYVAFDGYLAIRLVALLRGANEPAWRRTYGFLLATALFWMLTDSIEMLSWAGALPGLQDGTLVDGSLADLLWLPPWATLVLAGRVREIPSALAERPEHQESFSLGPLVVLAVSFPVLHVGLARLGRPHPDLTPTREILALVLLVVLGALVIVRQELLRRENRRLEKERLETLRQIEHLAFHDALTGLPNRRLLADRVTLGLGRALRFGRKMAVLLLDIDDFKAVNDTHGHDVGDEVLCQMARRIERCVRGGDTVARLGGDEFVAVVEGLEATEDCARVVEALVQALTVPFSVGEETLTVATTIGVAVFPDEAETLDGLLKQADKAMYRHKGASRTVSGGSTLAPSSAGED